jgi:hypothetical protein
MLAANIQGRVVSVRVGGYFPVPVNARHSRYIQGLCTPCMFARYVILATTKRNSSSFSRVVVVPQRRTADVVDGATVCGHMEKP